MSDYQEITKATYDEIAQDYAKRDARTDIPEIPAWTKALNRFCELVIKNGSVLDIGVGGGRDAEIFIKKGFNVTGIDISEKMLAGAKSKVPKANFMTMDMEELKFPPARFDGVWANASLHHMPKSKLLAVLKKIKLVLKPQGLLQIIVKQGDYDGILENEKFGRKIRRHFSYYMQDEIKGMISDSGFEVINCSSEVDNEWIYILALKKAR